MTAIFLDTVGLIALWDSSDQWHTAADAAFQSLLSQRPRLITTSLILCECANAASRRPYRMEVVQLRTALQREQLIVEPTPLEMEQAWAAFERSEAGGAGVIDLASFLVMRRLGIHQAFTNDRHFHAAGFATLF